MHHLSFTVALSRIDLHADTDSFLPLSYVVIPVIWVFLRESLVRLRRNRCIRLCFRSFVRVPILRVRRFWDGTPKALLYNPQREERMPHYISGLPQKASLRSRKRTGRRTSPSRKSGSWMETLPLACVSSPRHQKLPVYWRQYPNSTNVGSCSLLGIGMSSRLRRMSVRFAESVRD
jgi:hypothetical protein